MEKIYLLASSSLMESILYVKHFFPSKKDFSFRKMLPFYLKLHYLFFQKTYPFQEPLFHFMDSHTLIFIDLFFIDSLINMPDFLKSCSLQFYFDFFAIHFSFDFHYDHSLYNQNSQPSFRDQLIFQMKDQLEIVFFPNHT